MTDRLDLPQGTLDLLILKALSLTPLHGWAISERLRDVSRQMRQCRRAHSIRPSTGWNARAGYPRVGDVGPEPEGSVLSPDPRGTETTRGGDRGLGPAHRAVGLVLDMAKPCSIDS
jgi:hypothetical protein